MHGCVDNQRVVRPYEGIACDREEARGSATCRRVAEARAGREAAARPGRVQHGGALAAGGGVVVAGPQPEFGGSGQQVPLWASPGSSVQGRGRSGMKRSAPPTEFDVFQR